MQTLSTSIQSELLALGALVVIDQFSKATISYFQVSWRQYFLQVYALVNKNASFSLPLASPLARNLAVIALILIVLSYFFVKNRIQKLGLLVIVAGGISNVIDRVYSGGVVDIFHANTASWNIADMIIISGGVLVVISIVRVWVQPGKIVLK